MANETPSHGSLSHRKKYASASFSAFTSSFNTPAQPFGSKGPSELHSFKILHPQSKCSAKESQDMRTCDTASDGTYTIAPRTPMRVLKPPMLREALETENHSFSKEYSSRSSRSFHLHDIAPIADTGKGRLSSMTSHLPSLSGAVSRLASPKGPAVNTDKKLVPLAPPALWTDLPQGSEEPPMTTVSHTQRAEVLANSVRVSRTNPPANVELLELFQGVELSPQKGSKGRGMRFIKLVHYVRNYLLDAYSDTYLSFAS